MNFNTQDTTEEREAAILADLEVHAARCRDQIEPLGNLIRDRESDSFHLLVGAGESHGIQVSSHAEGQLLTRLRIPASYIHRCPTWMQAQQINYWINVEGDKNILLRRQDGAVRAIFSTRYKPDMDDEKVIPFILEALRGNEWTDEIHIKSFTKAPDFTEMTILFKDARAEHDCGICFAGIAIVNSEVGRSSLWIKPLVRYGNEYGRYDIIDKSHEGSTSFRHTGELKQDKIREALQKAREVSQVGIYRVFEASKIIIPNVIEATKDLVEEYDFLAQNLVDIIEEEYQDGLVATKLQLAESLLRAVKDLPLFKKHHAARAVGRYLDIFGDTTNRLDNIVQDLNQLEE